MNCGMMVAARMPRMTTTTIISMSVKARTERGGIKRTVSPLTPALSPLRGEGEPTVAHGLLESIACVACSDSDAMALELSFIYCESFANEWRGSCGKLAATGR